eukprot:15206754-Heterocapsa_arctica.AAC.1
MYLSDERGEGRISTTRLSMTKDWPGRRTDYSQQQQNLIDVVNGLSQCAHKYTLGFNICVPVPVPFSLSENRHRHGHRHRH